MDPFFSHRTGWNTLQDMIQTRTKRLAGAYEIHKFSRDAKDLLARIHVRPPPPPTPTPILWIHDAVHTLYMLSCNTLSMLTIACINVPCNACTPFWSWPCCRRRRHPFHRRSWGRTLQLSRLCRGGTRPLRGNWLPLAMW